MTEFRPFRCTGYFVSRNGLVRAPSGKPVKPRPNAKGYLRVHLKGFGDQYLHRMVLIAFRGEPPTARHESDHKNKKRADCRLRNLRWLEKSDNLAHRDVARGERQGSAKLSVEDVVVIRSGPFYRGRDADVAALGISREAVRDIRLRKRWQHIAIGASL
jgi:hypothetical protein